MYSDDSLENRSADIVVLKFSREHIRVREMWQRENTLDAHRMEGAVQEHVSSQWQIEPNSALITQTTRTRCGVQLYIIPPCRILGLAKGYDHESGRSTVGDFIFLLKL